MHEMRLTDEQVRRIRAVARTAAGWPLDDPQTLRDLRSGWSADPMLDELGTELRAAVDQTDAVLVHAVPTESDAAVLAPFQSVAVPSSFGNGGTVCCTVAPKTSGDHIDLSETDREFPPHTDSTFLREPHHYIALTCVERDEDCGGESYLLASDRVRAAVRDAGGEDALQALREPLFPFVLHDPLHGDGVQLTPVLGRAGALRYRRDVLDDLQARRPELWSDRARSAYATVRAVLDKLQGQDRFTLEPGDMLLLDNRRVLHGRLPITPGATRVLRRMKGYASAGADFRIVV